MLMSRHATATPAEKELTQAVRRVVDRYGNNLSGYFRRVEEIANKNAAEADTQTPVKGDSGKETSSES